ncbi:acyltransferase family protein [Flagellimonas iocasae]|uniref:Acyltransferase family protein n=1 Tax=Flagellimonas iocasae TaxID=2055905 RepID=A0ABW4Y542_9FLAO
MSKAVPERILSIDVFRGFTMFLLIGEFTGFMGLLLDDGLKGSFLYALGEQFHHHSWNGLHFWDLIQPFFMFIVGLSLPFGVYNRQKKGHSKRQIFKHVLKRSVILLFLGWALYCIPAGEITFYFQNVLAQIGVTYLIAYLIIDKSTVFQISFSVGLLVLTEVIYRFFPVEGFDQPFVFMKNFGTWLDMQYGGASNGGWAAFNAMPTAAHTIWGVLVGKLLMGSEESMRKLKIMVLFGTAMVIGGYLLDPVIPIIKRIATSSFVIVSGGWSILGIALLYGLIDVLKLKGKYTWFFSIVGMNSLFIYLFSHVGGAKLVERVLFPFSNAIFTPFGDLAAQILTSFCVWISLWGICYWMYKKRLFIKI